MPSRITVAVCVPMAGVGGTGRPLPGGTVFLAISGILFFALVFVLELRLLWSFLRLTQQFYICYIARVFDPPVGFFFVRHF